MNNCPFCLSGEISTKFLTDTEKYGAAYCESCRAWGPETLTEYNDAQDAPWRDKALAAFNCRPRLGCEGCKHEKGLRYLFPCIGCTRYIHYRDNYETG